MDEERDDERTAAPYEFSGGESKGDDDAPREGGVRRDAPGYEFGGAESSGKDDSDDEPQAPATAATKTPDGHFKGLHRAEKEREKERAREEREARAHEEKKDERKSRAKKLLAAALGIALLVVIVAVVISSRSSEATRKGGEQEGPVVGSSVVGERFGGIPQDGLNLGKPDAPVTLVEFADLQCPFCKQASDNSLPTLVDRYVRQGKLRIEFRNFAILGPDSEKAARALQGAAEQGRAWQFIDLWYLNQGEENSGYVTDPFIRRIARGARVPDPEAVVAASNDEHNMPTVEAARKDAEEFGVDSTPSYLLGRTGDQLQILQLQNPSDPNLFAQSIDRLLARQE